ncbi:MAG: hypothetical protein ACRYF3_11630 [Janthinobacterium lividum]
MSLSYSVFIKAPRDFDLITAVLDKFFGQEHVDSNPDRKLWHNSQAQAGNVLCKRPHWRIDVPGGLKFFTVLLDENYMREFDPEEDLKDLAVILPGQGWCNGHRCDTAGES